MPATINRIAIVSAAFAVLAASSSGALAQKKYDPGAPKSRSATSCPTAGLLPPMG